MAGDWMSLALERFQSATRTVRLTLPPGRHERFWERLVELAVMKRRGLTITLLLPISPAHPDSLRHALKALKEIELSGHEVGWAANDPLPFSLLVVDDLWALIVAGDPDAADGSGYARLTEMAEEVRPVRDAFDRRVARGIGGLDPVAWLEWLEQAPYRKTTRAALAALHRGNKRLGSAVRRELKKMPRRGFWLVKPHDSAYGMSEPPGAMHWGEWILQERVAMGFPALADLFAGSAFPTRQVFQKRLRAEYQGYRDMARAYATARHFILEMLPGDRVAAVDGWTSSQAQPVRFHGWGRIGGMVEIRSSSRKGWRVGRKTEWQRYEVEIPVVAVRESTGLQSCTFPIHRLDGHAFRSLADLAEEVLRSVGQSQLNLELTLMDRLSRQQELL
ncbi:MAG: hypothetical protein V2A56_04830 [bacterium]